MMLKVALSPGLLQSEMQKTHPVEWCFCYHIRRIQGTKLTPTLNLSEGTEKQGMVTPRLKWTYPYSEDEVILFLPHQATHFMCLYHNQRKASVTECTHMSQKHTQLIKDEKGIYLCKLYFWKQRVNRANRSIY